MKKSSHNRFAPLIWWLLPVTAIAGWFYPYLGLLVLVCMLASVLIGAWRGRYWCGWLCPRGAFLDYIILHISPRKPAPSWLRSNGFRIGALVFLMGMMIFQLTLAWPDPFGMARVFVLLLGITTIVGIVLALVYTPRTWCTFCPMGTMAKWVSNGKKPLIVSADCRDCKVCHRVCPMGLTPNEMNMSHGDCIKCERCVARCPADALNLL